MHRDRKRKCGQYEKSDHSIFSEIQQIIDIFVVAFECARAVNQNDTQRSVAAHAREEVCVRSG